MRRAPVSEWRFEQGLVVGKFYPPHAGHLHLVATALRRCERVQVQVLASSAESVPGELRAAWLREELPGADVVTALDDHPVDYADPAAWEAHVAVMRSLLDEHDVGRVDAVFTSDAYGAELAERLEAQWVQVDRGRATVPVSGRAVRADPAGHWWALPAAVRAHLAVRVVVVGAESTGTTTLSRDLAERFGAPWVPEHGREWCEVRPGGLAAPWHSAEFDLIAREQSRTEDAAARTARSPLVVCDTDALATAVWHERYVGHRSPTVEALAASRVPDLYLLTGAEVPFVQDGWRDGEHVRLAMHERFREVLAAQPAPWLEVTGSPEQRLEVATAAVERLPLRGRRLSDPLPERGAEAHDDTPDEAGTGMLTP